MNEKILAIGRLYFPTILVFLLLYVPFLKANYYSMSDDLYADFPSFYFAADNVFNKAESPYNLQKLRENEQTINQKILPFLYPPPTVLFFYPLTLFDYKVSKNYALLISNLLYLSVIVMLVLTIKFKDRLATQAFHIFLVVFLLSFKPVTLDFQHVQVNTILLFLITVIWISMRRGFLENLIVPICLSLAIFLKTYPALFLLMFLLFRQYKLVGITVALCSLIVIASVLFFPFGYWMEWISGVLPTGSYGLGEYANEPLTVLYNLSINGFIFRFFSDTQYSHSVLYIPVLVKVLPYLISFGVISLIVLKRSKQFTTDNLDREFSIYLLAIFLLAPIAWEDHITFLIPVFVLFARKIFEKGFNLKWIEVILCIGLILLSWRLFYNFSFLGNPVLNLAVSVKMYFLILFLIYFLFYFSKSDQSRKESHISETNETPTFKPAELKP